MKHQELIERYIYAVTRYMKKEEREDVAKELQSIIEDMLMERCGEEEPDEANVKAVLNELGNPSDLYEKYSSDGKDCLIGAPYYGVYKNVLKTVLMCVSIGLLIAQVVVGLMDVPALASVADVISFVVNMIVDGLATVFAGVLFAFAAVTLWFAVMYHKGIQMDTLFDSLEHLPQIPKKETSISKKSIAFGMGISILFFTLFLICPQVLCTYNANTGEIVPIFDVTYIHSTWYLIIAFGALGLWREYVKLIDGTYTKRLVVVTTIVDIASAVLSVIWLWNPQILNAGFVEVMRELFAESTPFVYDMMVGFNYFFLGCIWLALVLDWIVVVWKHQKCEK